ncbi:MAG: hypothetical protein Q9159_005322 [Coniocarpon cinnabarinum]
MPSATPVNPPAWSHHFDTVTREKLFRNPPKDRTPYPALAEAFRSHIECFNAVFDSGGFLDQGIKDIGIKSTLDRDGDKLDVRILQFFLGKSLVPLSNKFKTTGREIYPAECRQRHVTYGGRFEVRLAYRVNDGDWIETVRELGKLPILVRSNRCYLEKASPAELVKRHEESEDFGGYFIVNGIEKIIRMLIVTKRNYPLAIVRPSYRSRGKTYTEYGVQIRSVRRDQTSQTNVLHYLSDGNVTFRFSWRMNEYLVPAMMILRALVDTNDREIFQSLIDTSSEKGMKDTQSLIERVEMLLRTYRADHGMYGKARVRAYLGSRFRPVLLLPDTASDEECGTHFLRKIVLPHLGWQNVTEAQDLDKFRMMLFMLRKLYALVEKECAADNPDAASTQEVLLPSALYGMILKEKLEEWLHDICSQASMQSRAEGSRLFTTLNRRDFEDRILRKTSERAAERMEYFLATGNLQSPTGLDLQQTNGFTVVAEKLNFFRFLSHFRMVHRGSFFAQLKTTAVRKLLPESWGFICPVHTPDGAPCGLLNHLAHHCKLATSYLGTGKLPGLLAQLGVVDTMHGLGEESMVVQLDGKLLGYCPVSQAENIANALRKWKIEGSHGVPLLLEVGYVPTSRGGQYPGIYMFAHPGRMYRPVKHLATNKYDFIGPFEQPFMDIACTRPEIDPKIHTHCELSPTSILDIVSNQTPFSDYNQSPRNMYQCQMGKQTMGTPGAALKYRADNKMYQLECGQTPIVRPPLYQDYGLDNYPQGTNAVVAVISYTGYDMDDAMIINKSAHERGFGNGSIYKTYKIDLSDKDPKVRSEKTVKKVFGFAPAGLVKAEWRDKLDDDGLPRVGVKLREGDVMAASHVVDYDPVTKRLINRDMATQIHRYHDQEMAIVEDVIVHGTDEVNAPLFSVSIKLRVPRSPIIGDKFSSRHGQKGVCSQKWPSVDMPFSESGMIPDVIINPHAFPSRMTIGMFIESMAGKAGAMHGFAQDSTPWKFEDKKGNTAVEYFGHQLKEAGFNYYGNEPMYSGITGTELAADIYIGVVYYQRLRHMVNDKYQVRTTGPVTATTGQPVKGRSRGGGIRVGEMERDALIAHGTSYLLQDRLMNCSDYTRSWICRQCGSFASTQPTVGGFGPKKRGTNIIRCRACAKRADPWQPEHQVWEDGTGNRFTGGDDVTVVAVPGVLKYLDVELLAMGVRMKFNVTP